MMYFGSFFAGIINGLFASGAGQIVVFILVFVLKEDTHIARCTSVFLVSIITIFTFARYLNSIELSAINVVVVIIVGVITGSLGAKFMKKIRGPYLNVISGILIIGLSIYSLIRG